MNIFELYKKCIKGEGTPEETSQVESWLKENPEAFEAEMLAEILQMEAEREVPSALKQEMMIFFREKGIPVQPWPEIPAMTGAEPVVEMVPAGGMRKWMRWTAAAAVVILIVAGWRYSISTATIPQAFAWKLLINNSTEVKRVFLPDSSTVWMNAYSQIRYQDNFGEKNIREVELSGEAYFKVRTIAGRSFKVLTDKFQTQVLGTEFNVEAYPDEGQIRVSLQEGKVRVSYLNADSLQGKILLPGQMATYQKGTSLVSVGKSVSGTPQAWIKDELALSDISLRDALQRIGRKYGQKILFDTVRAEQYRHVTAHYRAIGLEQVLSQLGFSFNFNFKKDNRIYKISFKQDHSVR